MERIIQIKLLYSVVLNAAKKDKSSPMMIRNALNEWDCHVCSKLYSFVGDLRRHTQREHDGITYQCDVCEKLFPEERQLAVHKWSVKEMKKYQRSECEFQATTRGYLSLHEQAVHEEWLGNAEKSVYDELIPNVEFPGNKVHKFRWI